MRSIIITALLTGSFVLSAGGCLITSGRSVEESGISIGQPTLGQIEEGTTSEAWLIATLGQPTATTTVADQPAMKVMRYDHIITRKESGSVFLIFGGQTRTKKVSRTFFELQDGVVTRYWTEQ